MTTIGIVRENDFPVRFGERVRTLCKKQGWSQEAFAHQYGLDRTYVGGIERGERNIALRNIEQIAKTLGVTLSQLLRGL